MPEIFKKETPARKFIKGWKITEDLAELRESLFLNEREINEFEKITHPQKQLEFLAGKTCIQNLVNEQQAEYKGAWKDEHGKPHLVELPMQISISHSFPFAIAILSTDGPVGIDIELPREKHQVISRKYLNESELNESGNNLEKLCIQWSSKEAVYKEYGKKKLIFKENIRVEFRDNYFSDGIIARLLLDNTMKEFKIGVDRIEDHIICYTD